MKISLLDKQEYLAAPSTNTNQHQSGDNSYFVVNFAKDNVDTVVTKRATLTELGKLLITELNLVQYNNTSANNLNTLLAGEEAYSSTKVGEFVTADDRTVLNSTLTNVSYDGTNKKITTTTRGTTATDVVSVATLLSDMDLNISQITNTAGKTLATIDEASGKISATFQDISILSSQVSDKSDAINSSGSTLATSKAVKDALESLDITQITNTAGKTVATIDEADGKVSATFQDISILSSQISDKGTAGNVATLDENGHVPTSQLPSYVDDVVEGTLATFPATGETGKIYVDTATNTSYRWSGSQYTKVASDLSLGETSSTAYRGDYGAAAYAHGVTNKGSAFTSGLYKITTNSEGHVTAATAVEKSDITGLGIPGSDTTYEMDGTYDASTNKVATESTVSNAVSGLYTKPSGGIPASDLADTYFSIPELPVIGGTYTLQVVIETGEDPVFSWVAVPQE